MTRETSKSATAIEPKTPVTDMVELANAYAQGVTRLGRSREEAEEAAGSSVPQVITNLPHYALMESLWANVQDGKLQLSSDLLNAFGAPLDSLLTILNPLVEIRSVEIKFVEGTPGIVGEPGREITDEGVVLSPERTKLVVSGEATFLGIGVKAEAEFFTTKGQPHCLFKFTLAEEGSSWGIGSVFPDVPIVRAMKFTNPTVILTTSETLYSPALDAGIEKGFNYYGNLQVRDSGDSMVDFVGDLMQIEEVAIHAAVTAAGKFLLELAVKRNVTLIDGENFELRFTRSDASFEIGDEPTVSMANDLVVILTANGQDTHLVFTGGVKLEMESITGFFTLNGTGRSPTGELSGEIQNTDEWKPFDLFPGIPSESEYIPDLIIRQLSIQAGLTYNAPWIDNIGLHGNMRIGDIDGSLSILVDVNDPDHFVLAGSTDHITLIQLVSVMSRPTFVAYTALPDAEKRLLNQVVDVALSDVKVNIVPKATSIGGVHFRDTGVTVAGTVSIWGWQASMYLNVDYSDGITADAEMDPVNLPGILQIQGAGGDPYPELHMVLGPRMLALEDWFYISASVTLLGLSSEAQVRITDSGFFFIVSGKIFDLFKCTLEASGGDLSSDDVFFVKATMKNDLFVYLKREASKAIQAAANKATREISEAQRAVRNEKAKVNQLNKEIKAMRRTIRGERDEAAKSLRQAQGAVQSAQAEVNRLKKEINAMRQTIQGERDAAAKSLRQAQAAVQSAQAEVNRLNDEIKAMRQTIQGERDRAAKRLRDAQGAVQSAQAEVKQLDDEIEAMRQTIQRERDRDSGRLRSAQQAVKDAQEEVNSLQREINSTKDRIDRLKREIDDWNRWYDDLPWYEQAYQWAKLSYEAGWRGTEIGTLYTKIGGIEVAKQTAVGVLEVAKQTLRGLEKVADTFPIDADPRMVGLFTARETANATLEAARQTLRGLEEAADTLPVDADPRMAGLFAARETAKAALGAARQTLRALEGAVDAFPIDADPRMLGLFTAHETANAALEAARQTLRGLEGAVDTFPIDADPRMVGLFTARETANAGLEAANLVLEGVKQSVGALADVSEYIVEHGLGGLLDIRSASFEAGLNAAAGGRVSLQTELVFMGKEQEFAFQFNFENPLASAQDLSRLLLPT